MAQLMAELAQGSERVRLSEVAGYSETRVHAAKIDRLSYVGVDNLLAEKRGKRDSEFPPATERLVEYLPGDTLIGNIRPYLQKVWFATQSGGCSADVLAVRIKATGASRVDPKYLYYVLSSDEFFHYDMQHAKGAKMPRGDKAAILQYVFPLPSLESQRRIASILDSFAGLSAELQAELELRQLQYTHYRDHLLGSLVDVERRPLGDVSTVVRGSSPRPIQAFMTEEPDGVPWIKIGDVPSNSKYITGTAERVTPLGALKSRRIHPGDFVLSNSMSFGRPYISKIEGCIHDGWLAISGFSATFLPDFLYHLLRSAPVQSEFARRAGMGAVRNLNADIVKAVAVPIPTMQEQERIAAILDKFDLLVNDRSIGIPAEIISRRAQFEHYRGRLLALKGHSA